MTSEMSRQESMGNDLGGGVGSAEKKSMLINTRNTEVTTINTNGDSSSKPQMAAELRE